MNSWVKCVVDMACLSTKVTDYLPVLQQMAEVDWGREGSQRMWSYSLLTEEMHSQKEKNLGSFFFDARGFVSGNCIHL